MQNTTVKRETLGPFMSVICFRYLGNDAKELAGQAVVVDAGRQRGTDLIAELGLKDSHESAAALHKQLDDALGINGTRLCLINSVTENPEGGFEVHSAECADTTYTLGVLIGAISAITGKTMIGKKTGDEDPDSVECIYYIDPL